MQSQEQYFPLISLDVWFERQPIVINFHFNDVQFVFICLYVQVYLCIQDSVVSEGLLF